MYSAILLLGTAGLIVTSTVRAQAPERALLSRTPIGYGIAGTFRPAAPLLGVTGERALLAKVHNHVRPTSPARMTDAPVDGAGALLGKRPSEVSAASRGAASRSGFVGAIRGDVTTSSSGQAEFGVIRAGDGSNSGFTVSLGGQGQESAILFTRMSGTSLEVGRYRISDRGHGADEILALVTTGAATNPTGVFRGRSGWLVVAGASDRLLTGRFEVDAIGFRADEPQIEDRLVRVAGSFSAITAGSSGR